MSQGCALLVHRASDRCRGAATSEERAACLRTHGVHDAPIGCAGETRCVVSGSSEPYYVCLTSATQQPQVVYGLPLFGSPSKCVGDVTGSGKS